MEQGFLQYNPDDAVTYSLFQVVLLAVLGFEIQQSDAIFHIFLGILIAKHIIDMDGERDYNRLCLRAPERTPYCLSYRL